MESNEQNELKSKNRDRLIDGEQDDSYGWRGPRGWRDQAKKEKGLMDVHGRMVIAGGSRV